VFVLLTFVWVVVGLVAFQSGQVVEGPDGGGLTVVQSIYLMAQIITTTGYGDLTPSTDRARMFAAGYILFSTLVCSAFIMEVIERIVDSQQKQADHGFHKLFGETPEQEYKLPSCCAKYRNVLLATGFYCATVSAWTLFFCFYCDEASQVCEDRSVPESFYFAIVSCCGVGFGDIVPRTDAGMLFSGVGTCIGVGAYLNLVGAFSDTWLRERKHRRIEALTLETFEMADRSADGVIDLYEFTRFIVTRYGMVSDEVFDDIKHNFEELDLTGSGDLTMEDMRLMLARMRQNVNRPGLSRTKTEPAPGAHRVSAKVYVTNRAATD